jgi:hypothetical protein
MAIESEKKEIKKRKPWIEPKIETVSLVPKETVMGGCKSISDTHGMGVDIGCVIVSQCIT